MAHLHDGAIEFLGRIDSQVKIRGNRIEQHREGSAAYGVLLKDVGDLLAEGEDRIHEAYPGATYRRLACGHGGIAERHCRG